MKYAICCVGLSGSTVMPNEPNPAGLWLVSYDPEAYGGRGLADWGVFDDALLFETPMKAMLFWQQVPANRPIRDDGQPNRPLTAFTVEVIAFE